LEINKYLTILAYPIHLIGLLNQPARSLPRR
jgi:hypothetical protein